MRRLFALAAAIGMVAVSLIIRARLDDGDDAASGPLRLTCSVELDAPCQALSEEAGDRLELTIEAAGTTAERLAAAADDPGLDGWLVPEPWPDMVDIRRRSRALPALFQDERPTLARSPLVLVVWKERGARLGARCGGPVNWKCLGEAAAAGPWTASGGDAAWGSLKPGHGAPATDGIGLLVLGHAVAHWFGRTDISTFDLDDDGFARWFSALERSVPPSATSPLDLMLATGPAAYDATGTTEAQAGPLLASSARRGDLDLLYPSPMATADVTLASVGTGSKAAALQRLVAGDDGHRALAQAGWRVPGQRPIPGVSDSPILPPTSNLPSAGLLEALRTRR